MRYTFIFALCLFSLSNLCQHTVMSQHLLYEPSAPDYRPVTQQAEAAARQSLFDKLAPDPSLSTFMDVLMQVDDIFRLVNHSTPSSNNPDVITMFVPTNTAFRQSSARSFLQRLLETNDNDAQKMRNFKAFLEYHIVPFEVDLKKHHQQLPTLLNDKTIDMHRHVWSRRVSLNDLANVLNEQDPLRASNGVAYKIDHLLQQP